MVSGSADKYRSYIPALAVKPTRVEVKPEAYALATIRPEGAMNDTDKELLFYLHANTSLGKTSRCWLG